MPKITTTHLTTSSVNNPGSSEATASISPSANALVLVAVRSNVGAGPPNTPTITGASMTWVVIASTSVSGASGKLTLFRGLSASPGSGTLTIDFGGQSQDQLHWSISEFGNVDTSGTNGSGAIVQSATGTADGATSLSISLSAFSNVDNATFGGIGLNGGSNISLVVTPGSGFTEIAENNDNSRTIETEWRNDNDTSVDWSHTASQARDAGGIAVEIRAKQQGGGALFGLV